MGDRLVLMAGTYVGTGARLGARLGSTRTSWCAKNVCWGIACRALGHGDRGRRLRLRARGRDLSQGSAGRERGDRGRRRDRRQHVHRPRHHRHHDGGSAPRSTIWFRSATTSSWARTSSSSPRSASPARRGSGAAPPLGGSGWRRRPHQDRRGARWSARRPESPSRSRPAPRFRATRRSPTRWRAASTLSPAAAAAGRSPGAARAAARGLEEERSAHHAERRLARAGRSAKPSPAVTSGPSPRPPPASPASVSTPACARAVTFSPAPPNTGIVFVRTDLPGPAARPGAAGERALRRRARAAHDLVRAARSRSTPWSTCWPPSRARHRQPDHGVDASRCRSPRTARRCPSSPAARRGRRATRPLARRHFKISQAGHVPPGRGRDHWPCRTTACASPSPSTTTTRSIGTQLSGWTSTTACSSRRSRRRAPSCSSATSSCCARRPDPRRHAANAVVVGDQGVLNEAPLRFKDEFVRHKMLDLLGDLALLGGPLLGHVISVRSGHQTHVEFVKKLAHEIPRAGRRDGRPRGRVGHQRHHGHHAAPLPAPARRSHPRARGGQARRRAEERDHQRAVLRRPLPRPPDHARRAHHRGDGPVRRRAPALTWSTTQRASSSTSWASTTRSSAGRCSPATSCASSSRC